MRLIDVNTLKLHEFISDIPPYAILSHRWTQDEISYKDFVKGREQESGGYRKVQRFCSWVRQQNPGVQWAWVDTCCIDKRSSSELSEAINSMWQWYERSEFCLAHLADVPAEANDVQTLLNCMRKSDWFNRGWTLQELLAPSVVIFCDSNWGTIGHRSDQNIAVMISDVTGIPMYHLYHNWPESFISCASTKLSWASYRRTSREEDAAYCLLGLLQVNMPLLYGEGVSRAFHRLYEEFIRRHDDESIFATWAFGLRNTSDPRSSILSCRPFHYKDRGLAQPLDSLHHYVSRPPYALTNKGLQFTGLSKRIALDPNMFSDRVRHFIGSELDHLYMVPLNCFSPRSDDSKASCLKGRHNQYVLVLAEAHDGRAVRIPEILVPLDLNYAWNLGEAEERSFVIRPLTVSSYMLSETASFDEIFTPSGPQRPSLEASS